ncbi:hypothetical protein Hypma_001885 [Hypsizygus marmoreus]|uniref:Uncharacterized protein n=1 Tax=Hypsizygus marmoreus TaxID=39966 RepID=A0A369J5A3_HYPMA|nr:hypothetical protein Hypma_001885 [Hypsizygus marmoreus]
MQYKSCTQKALRVAGIPAVSALYPTVVAVLAHHRCPVVDTYEVNRRVSEQRWRTYTVGLGGMKSSHDARKRCCPVYSTQSRLEIR